MHTLYLGLYVDDLCYFSTSEECEKIFEQKLSKLTTVDFMGEVTHFLSIKFTWSKTPDKHTSVHLSQTAFAEQLVSTNHLNDSNTPTTAYRSGHPVDSVPYQMLSNQERRRLSTKLKSIIGSLLWLSQATRPDLSTIPCLLNTKPIRLMDIYERQNT